MENIDDHFYKFINSDVNVKQKAHENEYSKSDKYKYSGFTGILGITGYKYDNENTGPTGHSGSTGESKLYNNGNTGPTGPIHLKNDIVDAYNKIKNNTDLCNHTHFLYQ